MRIAISNNKIQFPLFSNFYYYRYNMNDKDFRTKKNSVANLKSHQQKTINNSYAKLSGHCQPKQPPNISLHYHEETRKKQLRSKQSKFYNCDVAQFHQQKTKTKLAIQSKPPRSSHSKNQQQTKLRKNKKQIYQVHPIKSSKIKHPKLHTKQNRQPQNYIFYDQNHKQKNSKTEFLMYEQERGLECKQKFIRKLKKTLGDTKKGQSSQMSRQNRLRNTPEHHLICLKSFEEQMAQFDVVSSKIQTQAETQALKQLFMKQKTYSSLDNYNCYLAKKQPEIDWFKRAVTMDWMIQIISELRGKRQVFALAANYVDRFLASTENLPIQKLQLLACAAISLGNKIEGITFNLQSLSKQLFSTCQVLQFEQKLAIMLKWKLNPPTANMWANRISKHWDMYLEHHINQLPTSLQQSIDSIKFKSQDNQGYKNFRMLMQYIDLTVLDIHTLQYHSRQLAASFLYIILNAKLCVYTEPQMLRKFPSTSKYLLEETDLNGFYCSFLEQSFGFSLPDLLPTVQYCSTFLELPLCFQLPNGISLQQQIQIEYSQLCSLQTWNPANKRTIRHRNRQFD